MQCALELAFVIYNSKRNKEQYYGIIRWCNHNVRESSQFAFGLSSALCSVRETYGSPCISPPSLLDLVCADAM
ncbi:unnamed protein product [Rotaria magnacalcarata]